MIASDDSQKGVEADFLAGSLQELPCLEEGHYQEYVMEDSGGDEDQAENRCLGIGKAGCGRK